MVALPMEEAPLLVSRPALARTVVTVMAPSRGNVDLREDLLHGAVVTAAKMTTMVVVVAVVATAVLRPGPETATVVATAITAEITTTVLATMAHLPEVEPLPGIKPRRPLQEPPAHRLAILVTVDILELMVRLLAWVLPLAFRLHPLVVSPRLRRRRADCLDRVVSML